MCSSARIEYTADRKRPASSGEQSPMGTLTTFDAEAVDKGPSSTMPENTGMQRARTCLCAGNSVTSSSLSRMSQLLSRSCGPEASQS